MGTPAKQLTYQSTPIAPETVREIGHQSWTADNLCVPSLHNDAEYYTTRWDALCPYVDVTEEMLAMAARPLIIYAVPPNSRFGVPINDRYGMADVSKESFWTDERRVRKFAQYEKLFKNFIITHETIPGRSLTQEAMHEMGSRHFEKCEIEQDEIDGFFDYVRNLDLLIVKAHDSAGNIAFTDMSILLPKQNQVYGSFCQWNEEFRNLSPGMYACVAVCRWAAQHGYQYYNLGPVGDYEYKSLFVTHFEPIYAIALADINDPLWQDITSPLNTDFAPGDVNKIYRPRRRPTGLRSSVRSSLRLHGASEPQFL